MKDWTFGRYSKFDHVFSCEQFMYNDKTEKTLTSTNIFRKFGCYKYSISVLSLIYAMIICIS